MKIWTHTKFTGHYPVGVAAVVIAETAEDAAQLLSDNLAMRGIPQKIDADDFCHVSARYRHALVLCDGTY